ncbi:hypothetical protein D3C72_1117230 [compost metagenome]
MEVGDQGVELLNVIPQAVQRVFEAAPVSALQYAVAFNEVCLGKPGPQRLKLGAPFIAQPALKLAEDTFIGVVKRLDVIAGDVWKKGDAIAIAAPAVGDFKDAAGADGFMNRLAILRLAMAFVK